MEAITDIQPLLKTNPIPDLGEPSILSEAPSDMIPFQHFLDMAVEALNQASSQEVGSNLAVQNYLQGQGSLEDAVFALNETTSMIQLANQVLTTAVTTFREIEQMQV